MKNRIFETIMHGIFLFFTHTRQYLRKRNVKLIPNFKRADHDPPLLIRKVFS